MKRCTIAAVISLFVGPLWAQVQPMEKVSGKTNTTAWRGTLVDSGCRSQTERQERTGSANRAAPTNRSENQSGSDTTSYPVKAPLTAYALITEDGKCMPFDLDSNEKVAGIMKINRDWKGNVGKSGPTKVEIIGTESGGTISVEDIDIKQPSQPQRRPQK